MSADADPVLAAPPLPVPLLRRPQVRRALLGLAALVAVVWWFTPGAFRGYVDEPHAWFDEPSTSPLPVLADVAAYPDRDVEVLWARPRVSGADRSSVELVLCDGAPGGGGVGAGAFALEAICPGSRPPRGEAMRDDDGVTAGTQMVYVITGAGQETVSVAGVDVLYRDGARLGYQHVGNRFEVTFDRP